MSAAPGWYQDPGGPVGQLRYFDGEHWTEHRAAVPPPRQASFPPPISYGPPTGVGRTTPDGRPLASWGLRFAAYLIDWFICGIISTIVMIQPQLDLQHQLSRNETTYQNQVNAGGNPGLNVLFHGLGHDFVIVGIGQLVIQLVYWSVFLRLFSATPGKLMIRLRVELASGPGRLSWSTVLKRVFVQFVPGIVTAGLFTLIDGLWPLGDQRRQALHEKWAKTQVIRLR